MIPRLPPRLRGLLSLVPGDCEAVADVGAGHGALSACLAASGRRVIATEAKDGPYAELRRNLALWNVGGCVDVRQGAGLSPIGIGEVDSAVVAGMGARTVLAIASAARGHRVRRLVLQCMQHHVLVEPWLAASGATLEQRVDVVDRRRVYPTWVVLVAPA
jgi:tRNA (adenine22-N1)-methyltransferase